jgi:glycerol-3-phosphate dehydrogenase
MQSAAETLRQIPGLNREGLVGSAMYFDAQVEFAERLVLENVLAAVEHGATALTYTRVSRVISKEARVRAVQLDTDKTDQLRARVVINAAGPWVDQVLGSTETRNEQLVGGTKGSHIVVAPFPDAPASAVYVEALSDRRPFFIIPWNGNYLIGTTDVRFEGDADEVCSELWEVDYLLTETNRAFPHAGLTRDSVLYTYSGVRPLPFTTNHDAAAVTRRHFLRQHPQFENLISVVGGKLTTYRSLAEECVDLVFRKLGRKSPPCETARVPLPGATGSRARQVLELAKRLNIDPRSAEIVYAFENELATTLADCFLRRTMIGLNVDRGLGEIEAAAEVGKRCLGWSEERTKREVENYKAEISRMTCDGLHSVK